MKRYEQGSVGMRPDPEGLWCDYAEAQAEIERLRSEVTKYKARMRLLRRWGYSERQWYVICHNHAEAYDWFDQDGVPI